MKAVIIGAGIGGLATANLLAQAGYDVQLYEQHASPGGRAGRLQKDGFTFDTGPSWYLMPGVFQHYYDLLGETVDRHLDLVQLTPAYKVYFEHQPPISISSNLDIDAQTFEAIEPGAGAALKKYVSRSDDIYQLSLKHFLYSNFTSPRDLLHRDIAKRGMSMLRLSTQPIDRYVSGFVQDQRLKQILEYPTVFLGTSPYKAPALYSLMSALDFKEGVFYPRGGLYGIIESLVSIGRKLGVGYHYQAAVTHITTSAGKAAGVVLGDGTSVAADIVISNADMHFTETRLLDKSDQSYPESYWRKREAGPSALLLYLGVRGLIPEFEHHTLLFVDDWKQNFANIYTDKQAPAKASIYISKTSQTDSSVAPAGHENIFVLVPLPAGVTFSKKELANLTGRYLAQIAAMTGVDLTGRIVSQTTFGPNDFRTQFHAWQSSMLGQSHVLTQSAFFRTPNMSKKVKNLYYVGANTTPGIGLPMCLISAELVCQRLGAL